MQKAIGIFVIFCLGLAPSAFADDSVRVATYNIKKLTTELADYEGAAEDREERLTKLKALIADMDADVIGLQEIDDRAALEMVFDKDDWYLIIDKESGSNQDVAVAIRRPFKPVGVADDLDADDGDFLFPDSADNQPFPVRRDILAVKVVTPDTKSEFWIMVVHAKSRHSEGRDATDFRREMASQYLIDRLEADFDDANFILLGDFNDNPDDRCMNILETGNPEAESGAENEPGAFLINLTEELLISDIVSHGLKSNDIDSETGLLDPTAPGSRDQNNEMRGTNLNSGDILFDQILIPAHMVGYYVAGSVDVFRSADVASGNSHTRASDHAPVMADFVFSAPEDGLTEGGVVIAALLPNPVDDDRGHEMVRLRNGSGATVDLAGWSLVDRAGNSFALEGNIDGGVDREVLLDPHTMPLNNSGDNIRLIDETGLERSQVQYEASQVSEGAWVVIQ